MESNGNGLDGINELLVLLNKADRCRHLFNILLEQLGLSPQSSRKDFFDAMLSLHEKSESASKALGELTARQAMTAKKKKEKTPSEPSVSVSN